MVGLSKLRENKIFISLLFHATLDGRGVGFKHGLFVIDMLSGDAGSWMRIDGIVEELYYAGGNTVFASTHGLWVHDRPSPARHPRWQEGSVVSMTIIRGKP